MRVRTTKYWNYAILNVGRKVTVEKVLKLWQDGPESGYEEVESASVCARVQCLPSDHPLFRDSAYYVTATCGQEAPPELAALAQAGAFMQI